MILFIGLIVVVIILIRELVMATLRVRTRVHFRKLLNRK